MQPIFCSLAVRHDQVRNCCCDRLLTGHPPRTHGPELRACKIIPTLLCKVSEHNLLSRPTLYVDNGGASRDFDNPGIEEITAYTSPASQFFDCPAACGSGNSAGRPGRMGLAHWPRHLELFGVWPLWLTTWRTVESE